MNISNAKKMFERVSTGNTLKALTADRKKIKRGWRSRLWSSNRVIMSLVSTYHCNN